MLSSLHLHSGQIATERKNGLKYEFNGIDEWNPFWKNLFSYTHEILINSLL